MILKQGIAAFKHSGGNAKLRQGYTLQQVIEYEKKNIDGYDGGTSTNCISRI